VSHHICNRGQRTWNENAIKGVTITSGAVYNFTLLKLQWAPKPIIAAINAIQ
jgi:hypothetical protein